MDKNRFNRFNNLFGNNNNHQNNSSDPFEKNVQGIVSQFNLENINFLGDICSELNKIDGIAERPHQYMQSVDEFIDELVILFRTVYESDLRINNNVVEINLSHNRGFKLTIEQIERRF